MNRRALVALAACLIGCGEADPEPPELLPPLSGADPAAFGPYGIGVTTFETTDPSEDRTYLIDVWYPTEAKDGEVAGYAITAGDFTLVELESQNGALRDAPLDYRGAPHPTVVFSHGSQGIRFQSVFLTEYLASHGFVVAAPDHVGNTFTAAGDTLVESARVRPIDVSHTLDVLLERANGWPDDPLAFSADPDRVGIAGHSFGGFTVMRIAGATIDASLGDATCATDPDQFFCDGWPPEEELEASARDPRFLAALAQTPGGAAVFQETGFADVAVPMMIQAGTLDRTTPYDEEAVAPFEALPTQAYLLTLEEAGHFTFSDMCTLVDLIGLTIDQIEDGCADENLPYVDAHRIINRHATAFFKQYVAGDDSFDYPATFDEVAPPATLRTR